MRLKCISSNVGTVKGPAGCGEQDFAPNQVYDLSEDFGTYVLMRYPKFFKRLDIPTPTKRQSYTEQVKTKIGFSNSVFDPDDVNLK